MHHPFAELLGFSIDFDAEGGTIATIEIADKHRNPYGAVHGAVLYALADTGMGGAVFPTLKPGESCATIEIKIAYFKAVREGMVQCRTRLVHRGRSVAHLESEITNGGRLVAKATGSFSIFKAQRI